MNDDRELLSAYVHQKSEAAFTALVRRHLDLVYSTALRVLRGDVTAAEDVAQEVFVRLARYAPSLLTCELLTGWLYTTTHHTAVKAIRGAVRRRRREEEAQLMHELTAPNPSAAQWEQVRPLLETAMHELPAADRDAVLLRFFEAKPFTEIGHHLALSENAARMRVERALERLSGVLQRRGIASTSTVLGALLTQHVIVAAPAGLATTIGATAFSPGAAVGIWAVVLQFMNTTKVSVALGLAAAAGLGFGVRQTYHMAQAERALAAVQKERDVLLAQTRAQVSATAASTPARGTTGEFDIRGYEQERARRGAEAAKANARAQIATASNPDMLRMRLTPFRATAALRFAPLRRALRFTPEEGEAFDTLLQEKFWSVADVCAAALARDLSRSDPAYHKLRDTAVAPIETKLQALLGDERYREYQAFEVTEPARRLVDQLAGKLGFASAALTLEQASRLAEVFTANALESPSVPGAWIEALALGYEPPKLTLADIHWDRSVAALSGTLAPEQLRALDLLYTEQVTKLAADRTFQKKVRELTGK